MAKASSKNKVAKGSYHVLQTLAYKNMSDEITLINPSETKELLRKLEEIELSNRRNEIIKATNDFIGESIQQLHNYTELNIETGELKDTLSHNLITTKEGCHKVLFITKQEYDWLFEELQKAGFETRRKSYDDKSYLITIELD